MDDIKKPRWKIFITDNLLMILTIIGVLAGVGCGFSLKAMKNSENDRWTQREIMYISFPGDLFLRMLKSLILPLIISSIISAIGSLDLSLSGKIGKRTICYYGSTTSSAVILGIILVMLIRPGAYAGDSLVADDKHVIRRNVTTVDTLLDLIRNLFPPNLVQAALQQYHTELTPPENADNTTSKYDFDISSSYDNNSNILGLVVFAIVMGITLGKMGESGRPLLKFFMTLAEAMMIITRWVIWCSPVGVSFLVASQILEIKDLSTVMRSLGMYFITVLIGLCLHGLGTLSIIFFICTRELPFKAISQMGQVLVTAFGTSSSSATMPVTLQCMDKMGIDPRISRFVVPIGATINMDGTALYEAVAALFIAQVRNVDLTFSKIIGVSITATAASIGAAGIPQAGLVTMVMVLNTVGLPDKDVTLILAVDWLLDRFRTLVNVLCDSLASLVVEKLSKHELETPAVMDGIAEAIELVEQRRKSMCD